MKFTKRKTIKNLRVFLLSLATAMTLSMTSCGTEAKELKSAQEQEYEEDKQQNNHLAFEIQTKEDYDHLKETLSKKNSIQTLTIHTKHIAIDLNILENCTKLQELSINGPILNSTYLSNCTKLKTLELTNSGISDIQFISKLKQMETLNLSGNYITDIQALENLSNLWCLNLENNPNLEIIEAIGKCKQLCNLNLSKTKVKSLSGLENLKNLEILLLNYDRVTDIQALQSLKNIRLLEMNHTGIEDLSILENLQNLENLYIEGNNISSPDVLCTLENLKYLNIANNYISERSIRRLVEAGKLSEDMMDITIQTNDQYNNVVYIKVENSMDVDRPYKITLKGLENQTLYSQEILTDDAYKAQTILKHNQNIASLVLKGISSEKKSEYLNSITNPERLKYLYLGECNENDLQYISKFQNLQILGIKSQILDFTFLNGLNQLEDLEIQGLNGSIPKNVEIIQSLENLRRLYISNCNISDISFLETLNSLEILTLYDNQIENIQSIEMLPNLKYLDIRKNNIQDISPIYRKAAELEVLALSENCIPLEAFQELEQYKVFVSEEAKHSQKNIENTNYIK